MKFDIRKSAIAAAASLALVGAGSIAAPDAAHANGKVAGALVGGLVLGAILGAHSRPVYGAPVYGAPVYRVRHPRCHWERQRVWRHHHRVWRDVKVCY